MWVAPEVGNLCLYRVYGAGGSFTDYAAIVTKVNSETVVNLTQFQHSGAPISRQNVNHCAKVPHTNGSAGWRWSDRAFMHGSNDCNDAP